MPKFIDAAGREWLVRIDVNALIRIRDAMSVNLAEWSEVGGLLHRMMTDDLFVAEVAFHVLRPEIPQRKISDQQFLEGIYGDVIGHVVEAIQESLSDFFRDPAVRAGVKKKIVALKKLIQDHHASGSASSSAQASSGSTPADTPSQS